MLFMKNNKPEDVLNITDNQAVTLVEYIVSEMKQNKSSALAHRMHLFDRCTCGKIKIITKAVKHLQKRMLAVG